MSGAERIAAERQRQIDVEGWTSEHDDGHYRGELGEAAHCYQFPSLQCPSDWPWDDKYWKPSTDHARNFEKAGALYQAEIDRLIRCRDECAAEIDRLAPARKEIP